MSSSGRSLFVMCCESNIHTSVGEVRVDEEIAKRYRRELTVIQFVSEAGSNGYCLTYDHVEPYLRLY